MQIEIGVDVRMTEHIDNIGKVLRNVAVTEDLPDHRAVLAIDQGVVIGVARAGFCLFHPHFVQQPGHHLVDVLAPVVRMKAENPERKLGHQRFEHRQSGTSPSTHPREGTGAGARRRPSVFPRPCWFGESNPSLVVVTIMRQKGRDLVRHAGPL